jgi:aspartyl-tRNA(Asn)/glutamyl-tRNA(Gln) amidotransferase subunit C
MSIGRAQVQKVAHLARLSLSSDEEETFAVQLSNVLGYIEKLGEVDVSGVPPLAFAFDSDPARAQELLRDDVPCEGLPREAALAAAPSSDGQSFLVPRILE